VVPFVLIPSDAAVDLDEDLPIVKEHLQGRYVQLTDVPVYEDLHIRILIDNTLRSTSRDAETGWPCFKEQ
jgi:hypothetical protein